MIIKMNQFDDTNLKLLFESNQHSHEFFHDVVEVIKNIPYAIIGSAARKCYINHRASTKDIDFLCLSSSKSKVTAALSNIRIDKLTNPDPSQLSIMRKDCDISLDFLFATNGEDPEESTVHDVNMLNIYGDKVRVAKPEYIVWLLCLSNQPKHQSDMKDMIKSKKVNMNKLISWMEYTNDSHSMKVLMKAVKELKL